MHRVLFRLAGVPIYSYPAMLYLGIVLGIDAQLYAGLQLGIEPVRLLMVTLLLLASALLGARLLFVISNWHLYRDNRRRVLRFADGGAAMYGGLFLAVPLSLPLTAVNEIPFATFWDLASLTMVIGMIVTRAGCFLNGCCAGRPTFVWWGMHLPNHRGQWTRRIPAQILEAIWGLVVLAGAIVLWRRLPFAGALFLYTIGAYAAGRIVLESAREDQDRINGFSVHRAISTAFAATSLVGFTVAWLRS